MTRDLRRRAMRAITRTGDVGDLRAGDTRRAIVDRRTAHYRAPIALAKLLLRGEAMTWETTGVEASAHLIRTPDLVEEGVRGLLRAGLAPDWPVQKERLSLTSPSGEGLNPDLVFGRSRDAIGDVKYKKAGGTWDRADVYEVLAFAVHSGTTGAMIVDFATAGEHRPDFIIGDVVIRHLPWDLRLEPALAAVRLVEDARAWLEEKAGACSGAISA